MGKNVDDHGSRFVASLVSSGLAEVVTLPIDTVKVRLQLQHSSLQKIATAASTSASIRPEYSGMVDCFGKIVREEGARSLWNGISPALLRQCLYSSSSLVLYEPIRELVVPADTEPNYLQRLIAGGSAGGISIAIFNWTEVVKTRLQSSHTRLRIRDVVIQVYNKDGLLGFWKGVKPNVVRTFLVNAAELGTYDQAKSMLIPYTGDNAFAHVGASSLSGVCSALVSTPSDVIKTRLMNSAGQKTGDNYTGILDALKTIIRDEGSTALYKGFIPICARKVVWCSTFFVLYEQARASMNQSTQ